MNDIKGLENIIAMAGSKRNPIVFRLDEYKGIRTLDIRKCYVDKSRNLKPTKKGISIGEKNFNILKNVINENEREIKKWLGGEVKTHDLVRKDYEMSIMARESSLYSRQKFSIRNTGWKSPAFFEHKSKGGDDELSLNEQHPFSEFLDKALMKYDEKTQEHFRQMLCSILISFCRAKDLFLGTDDFPVDEVFDVLEFNWGVFLKNYLKE